ncbi:MAG: hypothetical protein KBA61_13945 [Spirochaetes bacterium]|nr:hypothetical protein [Spirochaetota bacterium]
MELLLQALTTTCAILLVILPARLVLWILPDGARLLTVTLLAWLVNLAMEHISLVLLGERIHAVHIHLIEENELSDMDEKKKNETIARSMICSIATIAKDRDTLKKAVKEMGRKSNRMSAGSFSRCRAMAVVAADKIMRKIGNEKPE